MFQAICRGVGTLPASVEMTGTAAMPQPSQTPKAAIHRCRLGTTEAKNAGAQHNRNEATQDEYFHAAVFHESRRRRASVWARVLRIVSREAWLKTACLNSGSCRQKDNRARNAQVRADIR